MLGHSTAAASLILFAKEAETQVFRVLLLHIHLIPDPQRSKDSQVDPCWHFKQIMRSKDLIKDCSSSLFEFSSLSCPPGTDVSQVKNVSDAKFCPPQDLPPCQPCQMKKIFFRHKIGQKSLGSSRLCLKLDLRFSWHLPKLPSSCCFSFLTARIQQSNAQADFWIFKSTYPR